MFTCYVFVCVCARRCEEARMCVRYVCICISVCVFVCRLSVFLPVKRAVGDKGLQKQSSANECKPLWQPRRVTPSVSPLALSSQSATPPLLLFLLFSTLSVSMAIHTHPNFAPSLAINIASSLLFSGFFPSPHHHHHPYFCLCVSIFLKPINPLTEARCCASFCQHDILLSKLQHKILTLTEFTTV